MTTVEELGYGPELRNYRKEQSLEDFDVARVSAEHRERYEVLGESGLMEAELIGNLRYAAQNREDLPAVGDWVAISPYDEGKALIHAVYPRKGVLQRQAVGAGGQRQIIASNVDKAFIVQSVNRDKSINRLERYLTICNAAGIRAIAVLSKIDLISEEELNDLVVNFRSRVKGVALIALSGTENMGMELLEAHVKAGETCCFLGSSGVGKSTLINKLMGGESMATGEISAAVDRGKHVTTHRQLLLMDNGAVLIDNPGMRELGITESTEALNMTFEEISELAGQCKFSDCSHSNEKGCAVIEAIEEGRLSAETFENYQKMEREREHFESSVAERRKKDKDFGKMIKRIQGQRRKDKY